MATDPLADMIRRNRALAVNYVDRSGGTRRLTELLAKTHAELQRRIDAAVRLGTDQEFGAVQARACVAQLRTVMDPLLGDFRTLITDTGNGAASESVTRAVNYIRAAEERFKGIGAASSLRLREAMIHDKVISGNEASQLRRLMTSGEPGAEQAAHPGRAGILQRYGEQVVTKFEQRIQMRALARKPWDETRAELVADSPFLTGKEPGNATMWAERILRTETMYANNRANAQTIGESNAELGDMVKILVATFDDRTGSDSYAVHGQIRRNEEAFDTWYGAFMHPPDRPNDRETVIPHRISWPIPDELKWRSDGEIASRWKLEGRKGGPPARPKMTTIDLARFGKPQPLPPGVAPAAPPGGAPEPEVVAPPAPEPAPAPLLAPPGREPERAPAASPPEPELRNELGARVPPPDLDARALRRFAFAELDKLEEEVGRVRHGLAAVAPDRDGNYTAPWTPDSSGTPAQRDARMAAFRAHTEAVNAGTARAQPIRLDRIKAIDPFIDRVLVEDELRRTPRQRDYPTVVRFKGQLYATRGTQTVVAQRLEGKTTMRAYIVDLDRVDKPPKPGEAVKPGEVKKQIPPKIDYVPRWDDAFFRSQGVSGPGGDVTAAARLVFPKGLPSIQSFVRTWGEDPESGNTVKLEDVHVSASGGGRATVRINGQILNAAGRRIGNITRSFHRHADGKLEVHHDFYKIDYELDTGKGGGRTMLARSMQTYTELGVNYVTVDAAWIGKYAWPTFGYDWGEGMSASYPKRAFVDYAVRQGVPRARAEALVAGVRYPWELAELGRDDKTLPTVTAIVHDGFRRDRPGDPPLKAKTMHLGKAYMLLEGNFSGKIELDKPGSPSYNRTKERCGW